MNFPAQIVSFPSFMTLGHFFCSTTVSDILRENSNIPAVTILSTLVNCLLADPGLVSTCATVQSSFHMRAALI